MPPGPAQSQRRSPRGRGSPTGTRQTMGMGPRALASRSRVNTCTPMVELLRPQDDIRLVRPCPESLWSPERGEPLLRWEGRVEQSPCVFGEQ